MGCQTEQVYRLSPPQWSSQPDGNTEGTPDSPAVSMFADCALASGRHDVVATHSDAVTAICARLEGLPLAIKIAALHLGTLGPDQVRAGLDASFDLLNAGARDSPFRHQGLTTALDWSYRLLSEAEAAMFRLVSGFTGAFSMDDVIRAARRTSHEPEEVARWVNTLALKSLLETDWVNDKLHYRMLLSTQSYAQARVRCFGESRD